MIQDDELQDLMDQMGDGAITCTCVRCNSGIYLEPDATTAWCDHCEEIVQVTNPLIELGFI